MTATVAVAVAVAVAPSSGLPMSVGSMQVDSSDARKRRREILALQRTASDDANSSSEESYSAMKKRKVVVSSDDETVVVGLPSCVRSTSKTKKPQMKYDPEVPMTKEEAAVWRREQRRKRNRESAAASRQRQRARIDELELELNQWKIQFDSVQAKIRSLEEQDPQLVRDTPMEQEVKLTINTRSDTPEPVISTVSPLASPTTSTFLELAGEGVKFPEVELQQPKPLKMISRQA